MSHFCCVFGYQQIVYVRCLSVMLMYLFAIYNLFIRSILTKSDDLYVKQGAGKKLVFLIRK